MFERRSVLDGVDSNGDHREPAALRLGEVRGFELVRIAAFADTPALEGCVRSVLAVDLPSRMDKPRRAGEHGVFKVGPREYWIVGPQGKWIDVLPNAVPATVGSVTPLSHSRTRLFIEGPSSREVLSKGIEIDLHESVFDRDAYALTALAHTPILLHRTTAQRYELYVLRTFATHVWEWLTDAARPLGFQMAGAVYLDSGANPDSR